MQEYNRGVRKLLPFAAVVFLAACARDIQNSEAVRAGVLDYLTARQSQIGLDPNSMRIDVTAVSFDRNEARATVAFRPKKGAEGEPVTMKYTLDRKGDKWVVRGGAQSSGNPHGAADPHSLPPGHPPLDSKQ